jgi:hypothetical protein
MIRKTPDHDFIKELNRDWAIIFPLGMAVIIISTAFWINLFWPIWEIDRSKFDYQYILDLLNLLKKQFNEIRNQ